MTIVRFKDANDDYIDGITSATYTEKIGDYSLTLQRIHDEIPTGGDSCTIYVDDDGTETQIGLTLKIKDFKYSEHELGYQSTTK